MKPALYNTTTWNLDQRELAEVVYKWRGGVGLCQLGAIAFKFGMKPNSMRPIVELLMQQERIVAQRDGLNRVYGIGEAIPAPLERARTWKPFEPTKQHRELWARLKAERDLVQSKHI